MLDEHVGVLPHECPACIAYAEAAKRLYALTRRIDVVNEAKTETITVNGLPYHRLAIDSTGSNSVGTSREALHEEADRVIRGILGDSNDGLSRGKVDEIGRAVTERQTRETRDDGFRRAIRICG